MECFLFRNNNKDFLRHAYLEKREQLLPQLHELQKFPSSLQYYP